MTTIGRRLLLQWALAGAALGALPLAAGAGEAPPPKKLRIASVAYFQGDKVVYQGASAIVAEQGWLARELRARGVELEWFPAPHSNVGPVVNEAFANGSIDFAAYGDLPAIIVNAGGVSIRVVVPNGRGQETFLVVPADSTARSIEDLKGKRVAIHRGRPWELPFSRLLQSRGLTYRDFRLYNINPPAGAAAIAAGGVDALYTLSDAYLLEDKGVGRIIWSTKEAPPDWRMRAELWGASAFLDTRPELSQLVATAYVKAAHWSAQEENRDELVRINARSGTPESVIVREYDDDQVPWRERWSPQFAGYVEEHYRNAVDYAVENRLIRRRVDYGDLVDTRFVPAALRELGLEEYWDVAAGAAPRAAPR
jgi:sulfonate transport system substrate-binding protein